MTSSSADLAHERLREAIVTLELHPGEPVSEARLVERFDFSMAATRSALARLRTEGLVVSEPRRGHTVSQVTLRDVREIYDLRLQLEPPAAATAAGQFSERDFRRLRTRCVGAPDLDALMAVNRAIHLAIAEAAGNRRAATVIAGLLDDSERARRLALRAGAAEGGLRVRDEHLALLDALRSGDGREARRLVTAAIRGFRSELLGALDAAAQELPIAAT